MADDEATAGVPVEMEFNVGDRVRTTKYGDGVVRYCGPHKGGKPGLYVGIELDSPSGKMSGKVGEHVYFACQPNHGALLLARKVELIDKVEIFAVGDLVKCGDLGPGVVEYFGPHAQRAWFVRAGIRLLEKNGVHDGTVDGHTYFQCEDGYGLLVKPDKLEMKKPRFAFESKWHQRMALKELQKEAEAEEEARKLTAEEEAKAAKKRAKEALTSRYKPPSTGFSSTEAASKEAVAKSRKASGGHGGDGSAAAAGPTGPVARYDAKKEDEFDIQAVYDVKTEHKNTIRRRVGSRTYLFEQTKDELADDVKSRTFGSLSGMYVEVASWTFWSQRAAEVYLAKWAEVSEDDRAAEAFSGIFPREASASGEVSYLVLNIGTCQQFVTLYGDGNAYHLIEESKGVKFADRKVAKAMLKQNGMKRMSSHVFVVKSHAKMQDVADHWAAEGFSCSIVETPDVSLVGGWRTVAGLCKKPDWVAVVGEYTFANSENKETFVKSSNHLSAGLLKDVQGVDKEKKKGQIRPVAINYALPGANACLAVAMYDGAAWASQANQEYAAVAEANVYVLGPGATTEPVVAKTASVEAEARVRCVALGQLQL